MDCGGTGDLPRAVRGHRRGYRKAQAGQATAPRASNEIAALVAYRMPRLGSQGKRQDQEARKAKETDMRRIDNLQEFIKSVDDRKRSLGITDEMFVSARNTGESRTPEKREMLREMQKRAAAYIDATPERTDGYVRKWLANPEFKAMLHRFHSEQKKR